jgi:hypothetical protein
MSLVSCCKHWRCGSFEMLDGYLNQSIGCFKRQVESLTAQLAERTEQLQTVHGHVKEALELLGVDVSTNGYIPDSWTLREQCHLAGRRIRPR